MRDEENEIAVSLSDLKSFNEDQLYLDLSHQDILEYRRAVAELAKQSLSQEDRHKMEQWQGAGLYGPISAVFGKLEDRYQLDIMRARQEEPNVDQGKSIFVRKWKTIQDKVCKEWNYCEKRKEFSDENKLLISIIGLAVGGTDWHVRTATAVVLLAWNQGPKFICDCPDTRAEVITLQSSESSATQGPDLQAPESTKPARRKGRRVTRRRD
jgi:hypothetical protein